MFVVSACHPPATVGPYQSPGSPTGTEHPTLLSPSQVPFPWHIPGQSDGSHPPVWLPFFRASLISSAGCWLGTRTWAACPHCTSYSGSAVHTAAFVTGRAGVARPSSDESSAAFRDAPKCRVVAAGLLLGPRLLPEPRRVAPSCISAVPCS